MLAIAVAVILVAACGALLAYTSMAVNHIAEARESRLMERAIERSLQRLGEDVASVAVWSDAYDFTARTYDPAWAQVNYGTYFFEYQSHGLTVVFDDGDRPIYASVEGVAVPAAHVATFAEAARPLIATARHRAEQKITARAGALGFDRVGGVEAAVRVGRRVYLVAASTVVPEAGYSGQLLARPDPVVVSAREVDEAYLASLGEDFGLKRARLLLGDAADRPTVILRDLGGRRLAAVSWAPERPGIGVYRDALGVIVVVGIAVAAAVAWVLVRLRQMAAEVERARQEAEAGSRAKAAFLANMSHEIRTPLNGVIGMAQALERYDLGPDEKACVQVIRSSGVALLGVLNDVLDLSKIEAGRLDISEAPFRLDEVAGQVGATFAELAATKDLALRVEVDDEAAGPWMGDALRIRQVLANLVSNGVKFTSQGSVTLNAHADPGGVTISVVDTGIGLDEGQISRLFEKFSQADSSTTRLYGGSGLGLAICRELVSLMGGVIAVRSRPGEGSEFSLRLPLQRAVAEPCTKGSVAAASALGPLRVLAAEDNPTNQLVLRAMLDPMEVELTLTSNGREAVEAFASGDFDVVLMDIQMPVLNGLDATLAIRHIEAAAQRPRTPILALTANVMSHQVEAYRAAGMDGHVAKPLDAAALYAELSAVLSPLDYDQAAA